MFGLQSLCFGAMVAWGPPAFEQAGWSERDAALAVTSIGFFTIVAGLTIVRWSDRGGRIAWLLAAMVLMTVGVAGVAASPEHFGGVWMIAFGIGGGATMPLCLTIPFDFEHAPAAVGELTGWMLGLGYLVAACGPALVGGLRDLTGGFTVAFAVVTGLALIDMAMAAALPRLRRT
jgi:MFS transporter, CP family, cyanate transporter